MTRRHLLLPLALLALTGCDRWHTVRPAVLVEAETTAAFTAESPGVVVVEHQGDDSHWAVGALCGEPGPLELDSRYLLTGCSRTHEARAYAAPLPEDLSCEQDYSADGVFLREPDELVPTVVGDWVVVFPEEVDGCWAEEESEVFELGL